MYRTTSPRLWDRLRAQATDPWNLALLSVLLLGLLFRLRAIDSYVASWSGATPPLRGDEPQYDNGGRELVAGFGFTWLGRVPLYPMFLGLIYAVSGGSYPAAYYGQALLSLSVVVLTYALGARVLGPAAGLVAALWTAISYVLVRQPVHLLSEVLYTPVVLVVALSLWHAVKDPSRGRFAWAGFWLGVSNLIRPALLAFPLAAPLLLAPVLGRRGALRYSFVLLVVSLITVSPWVAYTVKRFGVLVPLQTSNAVLWQGSPEYYHLVRDQGYGYWDIWKKVLYGPGWEKHSLLTVEGDRYWNARALSSIRREPFVYAKFCVEKAATFWVGDPNADWGDSRVFDYRALRRLGYPRRDALHIVVARLLPLAALAAVFVLWHRRRNLVPIYAILLYSTLLHALTHAEARLSEPLQPLLAVLIAGAMAAVVGRHSGGDRPVAAGAGSSRPPAPGGAARE